MRRVVLSSGPQTFGQRLWGNFGSGFPLMGTRGMKWLCPLLLQAMTMGELSLRTPLASLDEHSGGGEGVKCVSPVCTQAHAVHLRRG